MLGWLSSKICGLCLLRAGNLAMRRIEKPSIVEARYAELGMPARFSRVRKAATPAFVWVRMRMGLSCVCAMSVSAINCVFPQPAGAVIDPRSMARRSISGGTCEGPELIRDGFEPCFGIHEIRAYDVSRDVLVGRQRLEPPTIADTRCCS